MEYKRLKSFPAVQRADKRFHHQPDDGTQLELALTVGKLCFQHFGKMPGQPLRFPQILQIANHRQFHCAS
jgi:hypothetical protein